MAKEKEKNRFKNWRNPSFTYKGHDRDKCEYGWNVWHLKNLELGKNVDVGHGCKIFCHEKVEIQDNVQIGGNTILYTYDSINDVRGPIVLEEGCCVGAQCLILPGTIVKTGVLIKAKSIVRGVIEKNG